MNVADYRRVGEKLFIASEMPSSLDTVLLQIDDDKACALLLHAAEKGDGHIVEMLIRSGINVNHTNPSGQNALLLATRNGQKDIVISLLKAGAKVNRATNNNISENPLFVVCETGSVQIAKSLIEAGASLRDTAQNGDTPLIHAARYGHAEMVEELLLAGADVDAENLERETALMKACQFSRIKTAKCLIRYGANVDHMSCVLNTPLIRAVSSNTLEICKDLVYSGANVNASNQDGTSALTVAAKYGRTKCLEFLITSGSNLNHTNQHRQTALWFAVCQSLTSCSPCLMYLLQAGVKIDYEFHCAVGFGLKEVVKKMMFYGACPCLTPMAKLNIRPPPPLKMVSPLCMALLTQSVDIARYLINVGFLTYYDLHVLPTDPLLRQYLTERAKRESLILLDTELCMPMTLATLSFVTVSKAIGFKSPQIRHARVRGTGLPPLLQRKLMFE